MRPRVTRLSASRRRVMRRKPSSLFRRVAIQLKVAEELPKLTTSGETREAVRLLRWRERRPDHVPSDRDSFKERDRDLDLVFQEPARSHNGYSDKATLAIEAKMVALGRLIEIHRFRRVGAMQIEHVAAPVVVDPVEGDVADRDSHGKALLGKAVMIRPRPCSKSTWTLSTLLAVNLRPRSEERRV